MKRVHKMDKGVICLNQIEYVRKAHFNITIQALCKANLIKPFTPSSFCFFCKKKKKKQSISPKTSLIKPFANLLMISWILQLRFSTEGGSEDSNNQLQSPLKVLLLLLSLYAYVTHGRYFDFYGDQSQWNAYIDYFVAGIHKCNCCYVISCVWPFYRRG